MKDLFPKLSFYLKPLAVITIINIILLCVLGAYLEDYETYFAAFLHGTFTKPWGSTLNCSSHIVLLHLYKYIAFMFPNYNVYGIILFMYNWIILTILGLVLYRILRINLSNSNLLLFVLIFGILSVDSFLNIHHTRQTFFLMAAVMGFIESCRFEGKKICITSWILITIVIIFATLIRFESVWLFSLIYIVALLLHKKFTKIALLPLFISGLALVLYYNILVPKISEANQVYIYKEREIYDRNNIDYSKLNNAQLLDVKAIMQCGILDKEHYTLSFYNAISKYNSNNKILSLTDGIRPYSILASIKHSKNNFFATKIHFIFFILSTFLIVLSHFPNKKRYIFYAAFMFTIPFAICSYTIVPLRFLIPYLSILICVNILVYIKHYKYNNIFISFLFLFLLIIFYQATVTKSKHHHLSKDYELITSKLHNLSADKNIKKPIIINNLYPIRFFPRNPFTKIKKVDALFLNLGLFGGWEINKDKWAEECHCNALSLKEKIIYMIENQNLYIVDEEAFKSTQAYLSEKHHLEIKKTNISKFDSNLYICKLDYNYSIKKQSPK
jgi:hypothetical protein